jgi:hypothetical protein
VAEEDQMMDYEYFLEAFVVAAVARMTRTAISTRLAMDRLVSDIEGPLQMGE